MKYFVFTSFLIIFCNCANRNRVFATDPRYMSQATETPTNIDIKITCNQERGTDPLILYYIPKIYDYYLPSSCPPKKVIISEKVESQKIILIIAVDTASSMDSNMKNLKASVASLGRLLKESGYDASVKWIFFSDYNRKFLWKITPFEPIDTALISLDSVVAAGGGDFQEAGQEALAIGIQSAYDYISVHDDFSDAKIQIFYFSNAPMYRNDPKDLSVQDLADFYNGLIQDPEQIKLFYGIPEGSDVMNQFQEFLSKTHISSTELGLPIDETIFVDIYKKNYQIVTADEQKNCYIVKVNFYNDIKQGTYFNTMLSFPENDRPLRFKSSDDPNVSDYVLSITRCCVDPKVSYVSVKNGYTASQKICQSVENTSLNLQFKNNH